MSFYGSSLAARGRGALMRRRSALLLSSAFSLAAITEAQAQPTHEDTGPGDVMYQADSVSGMPEVAFLSSPDGNVSATIGSVLATGESPEARVVEARVTGANTLNLSIETLTVQTQTATAIYTSAGTGLTDISVGSLQMSGLRGIAASSQGDVSITAGSLYVDPQTGTLDTIEAIAVGRETDADGGLIRLGGSLSVDADSIYALGNTNAYAVHADLIGNATVNIGTAVSDGEGIDIAAEGNVDVTVRERLHGWDGAMSLSGDAVTVTVNQGAIVSSAGGALEVEDANTVSITNNGSVFAYGNNDETGQGAILATAQGAITIVSNYAESNADVTEYDDESATIQAISQTGPVSITADQTVTNGGSMYGIFGYSDSGDVTIDAGTTRSTETEMTGYYTGEAIVGSSGSGNVSITADVTEVTGYAASAIVGVTQGAGSVTIVSGTARSISGGTIFGISNGGGDVSITTTGDTSTQTDGAIIGRGGNVTIATGAGTLTSAGAGNTRAVTVNASGNAVLDNAGTMSAAGALQTVQLIASGTATVTSAETINSGTGAAITANGAQGVSITAETVSVAASTGVGVSGVAATGNTDITVGSITGAANGVMVLGQANAGHVSLTVDDLVNTASTTAAAIQATTGNGATIFVGNAEAESNVVRVVTSVFTAQGDPIIRPNDGHVSVTTNGAVTSRTFNPISIISSAHSFDVHVGAGSVLTGNGGSAVIAGGARVGDIDVVNDGLIIAQGAAETGIGVTAFGLGNVTVTSNEIRVNSEALTSGIYTSGAISAVATGGDVTVTSALATVTGPERYGIAARTVGEGDVSVTSGTLSKDADGYAGIQALSESGDITIASTSLTNTGAGAYGIEARSSNGGDITITSGTLVNSATGRTEDDFGEGIVADTAGTVRITSTSLTAAGEDSWGIFATGGAGAYVTTGAVSAQSNGVIAQSDVFASVLVDGAVNSATAEGVTAFGRDVAVTVAQGGSATGGTSGLSVASWGGGSATIVNAGTITGGSDAALVASGTTTFTNAGTLTAGAGGLAALLDVTDDTVILQSGSAVTGVIDTGAGLDTVRLEGAAGGTLASFANAEALRVDSGLWSTGATANYFDTVDVASAAELQVNLAADGSSGIETGLATVTGTLTLNYTDTSEAGDISGVAIAGTGTVRLIGAGELVLGGSDVAFTGTTRIENGTLSLSGDLAADVVTTGAGVFRITDGSNFTGDLLNDGTFVYDRTDSYTIAGDFSGTGLMVKNGTGELTFGGLYAFTGTTTINGGTVKFAGQLADDTMLDLEQGTVDLSNALNGAQTIAELSGSADGTLALGATVLTVNQTTDSTFGGAITGTGGLTKTGTGTLDLTGTSTYSGDTQVQGGVLKVNGALPNSTVIVDAGGTLGGNGTIGGLAMNGGTLAPGNSIGRLTVNGDVAFTAASTYVVEANAAGQADRIDATGSATLGGAAVQVLAESGRYRGRTSYTILTAAEGVNGSFGSVSSNFAFLTPSLSYDATSVTLNLTRNDADFASLATTANGRAVGGALQALGAGNALFEETLFLQDSEVQPNFASLSGEIYPALAAGLMEDAQILRRSLIRQPVREDEGAFGWATLLGSWGTADATAGTAKLSTDQKGVMGGIGFAGNGLNAALGIGRIAADYSGNGHADVDSTVVAGTLRYAAQGFSGTVGVSYAWHDIDTARSAVLGTIANSLRGKADGSTRQVFGEIGYGLETGGFALTPFAGIAYVETRRDALTETGGATALTFGKDKRHATYADLGLRIAGKPGSGEKLSLAPYASAAWRRAWGDRTAAMQASIGGAAGTFEVVGPAISRDAADLAAGVIASVGALRVSAGYEGLVSSGWQNHSAQLRFSIAF